MSVLYVWWLLLWVMTAVLCGENRMTPPITWFLNKNTLNCLLIKRRQMILCSSIKRNINLKKTNFIPKIPFYKLVSICRNDFSFYQRRLMSRTASVCVCVCACKHLRCSWISLYKIVLIQNDFEKFDFKKTLFLINFDTIYSQF